MKKFLVALVAVFSISFTMVSCTEERADYGFTIEKGSYDASGTGYNESAVKKYDAICTKYFPDFYLWVMDCPSLKKAESQARAAYDAMIREMDEVEPIFNLEGGFYSVELMMFAPQKKTYEDTKKEYRAN